MPLFGVRGERRSRARRRFQVRESRGVAQVLTSVRCEVLSIRTVAKVGFTAARRVGMLVV